MRPRRLLLLLLPALVFAGYDPLSVSAAWLIDGYKLVLSPLQGRQMCNFWPTCSQFTAQAIQEQDFLPGVVIGADRLMRCHQFAWSYFDEHYVGIEHDRMRDPVANHIAGRLPPPGPATIIATDDPAPPDSGFRLFGAGLDFAAWLFKEGDFARAGDEYTRVAFLAPDPATRNLARLMAGESFLRAGKPGDARRAFAASGGNAGAWGEARALFAAGAYDSTRRLLAAVDSLPLRVPAAVLAGWSLYRQRRLADAARSFAELPADSLLGRLATMDGSDLSRRSRALGTVLSALVPGAGQLYAGRAADGLYALFIVAGSGALTWWFASDHQDRDPTLVKTSLFGALTALFHAGNIHGANIAARDYNLLQERRYLERVEELLARVRLEPDYSRPAAESGP